MYCSFLSHAMFTIIDTATAALPHKYSSTLLPAVVCSVCLSPVLHDNGLVQQKGRGMVGMGRHLNTHSGPSLWWSATVSQTGYCISHRLNICFFLYVVVTCRQLEMTTHIFFPKGKPVWHPN